MSKPNSKQLRKNVLVTGANGFVGNAVAKAFVTAGYKTFGLVRKKEAVPSLVKDEIIPILGSPDDQSWLGDLQELTKTLDIIVSTTEDFSRYTEHFSAVVSMLGVLAQWSLTNGVRSLVLFTSGCKDYGVGEAESSSVQPFTETSSLKPPPRLLARTELSRTIFEHKDVFDAVVTRPTTLYGRSGSWYGTAFELAAKAAASPDRKLVIPAPPGSIMHGTHVSDVAAAYVRLAESTRAIVAGQVYNISSRRYETAEEVGQGLVKEYNLNGMEFGESDSNEEIKGMNLTWWLFGFSQWIGSDKIRGEIGWHDRQPLFVEGLSVYRQAYEAALQK